MSESPGFYVMTDAGLLPAATVPGPPGPMGPQGESSVDEVHDFTMAGVLVTRVGTGRVYLEESFVLVSVRASVGTAPTGSSVLVDVNKNGTTIYATQSNRPTIPINGFTATANSPDVTTFVAGDYLTVDVDQVGSAIQGANLVLTIRLRRT